MAIITEQLKTVPPYVSPGNPEGSHANDIPSYSPDSAFFNALKRSTEFIRSESKIVDAVFNPMALQNFARFSRLQDPKKVASFLLNYAAELSQNEYAVKSVVAQISAETANLSQDLLYGSINQFNQGNIRDADYRRNETGTTPRNDVELASKAATKFNPQLNDIVNEGAWKGSVAGQELGSDNVLIKPLGQQLRNATRLSNILSNIFGNKPGKSNEPDSYSVTKSGLPPLLRYNSYTFTEFSTESPKQQSVKQITEGTGKVITQDNINTPFRNAKPLNYNSNSLVENEQHIGSSTNFVELNNGTVRNRYNEWFDTLTIQPLDQVHKTELKYRSNSSDEYEKIIIDFLDFKDKAGGNFPSSVIPMCIELFGNETTRLAALFYPHLESISESYSPQWQEYTAYGRTEPIYSYLQTGRSFDISFVLYVTDSSEDAMNIFKNKINYLARLCYPKFDDSNDIRKRLPPLLKFSLGDLFHRMPCFFNGSLSIDWLGLGGGVWDVRKGSKIPRFVTVSTSLTILHEEVPDLYTNFYGWKRYS